MAIYFPLIQIRTAPVPLHELLIPASGTMAGMYSRLDDIHGVWTFPAGTEATLQGLVGLHPLLTVRDINLLTSVNINSLIQHTSLGYVAWGARTLSQRVEWKYVSVKHVAVFLEQSSRK